MWHGFFIYMDKLFIFMNDLRKWLTTPLVDLGGLGGITTPLSIMSISVITLVLIMKIIHVLNPVS